MTMEQSGQEVLLDSSLSPLSPKQYVTKCCSWLVTTQASYSGCLRLSQLRLLCIYSVPPWYSTLEIDHDHFLPNSSFKMFFSTYKVEKASFSKLRNKTISPGQVREYCHHKSRLREPYLYGTDTLMMNCYKTSGLHLNFKKCFICVQLVFCNRSQTFNIQFLCFLPQVTDKLKLYIMHTAFAMQGSNSADTAWSDAWNEIQRIWWKANNSIMIDVAKRVLFLKMWNYKVILTYHTY